MLLMVLKAGEELRIPNMVTDYNLLRSKVLNALSDNERQQAATVLSHIEFDMIRIMPKGYIQDVLKTLLEAFQKSCDLELSYYHPERDETDYRRFSPTKLFFENGGWYITGYCHLRQAMRTFRLDRIVSVTCLEEENVYMNRPLSLPEHDKFTCHTYELIIEPALYRIIKDDDYLQHAEVKPIESGLYVTVRTPYKNELQQLVLCHPEQVTVIKPEIFVQEIKRISKSICKKYLKP